MGNLKTMNRYSFPVKLETNVRVYYNRSPAHVGRLKFAVDFIVPEGTKMYAALSGVVIDVKSDSNIGGDGSMYDRYGNYIEIEHEHGEVSIYEHIKQNGSLVRVGDEVEEGQLIGFSGNTGWLGGLGAHLHFDVHKYYGTNPEDYKSIEIRWKKSLKSNLVQTNGKTD